jgi:N6-adenosine-specific RNA methylase IME4
MAPVGEHSQKPEEARRRIERLVGGPCLELFGREERENWTVWGNQMTTVDKQASR